MAEFAQYILLWLKVAEVLVQLDVIGRDLETISEKRYHRAIVIMAVLQAYLTWERGSKERIPITSHAKHGSKWERESLNESKPISLQT